MRIDDTGNHGAPVQVDDLRAGTATLEDLRIGAYGGDARVLDRERLHETSPRICSVDGAV